MTEQFVRPSGLQTSVSSVALEQQHVTDLTAPDSPGSFFVDHSERVDDEPRTDAVDRLTFDHVLRRKHPFVQFPRHRDPCGEPTLPPEDVRLIDLSYLRCHKIPTPVDERGIVDTDRLIADVNATIDPSYRWSRQLSLDHLYWPGTWYDGTSIGARFRQLTINKAIVPRVWENWKHAITEPPALPSE